METLRALDHAVASLVEGLGERLAQRETWAYLITVGTMIATDLSAELEAGGVAAVSIALIVLRQLSKMRAP